MSLFGWIAAPRRAAPLMAALALLGCKAAYTGEGSLRAALAAHKGEAAFMTGIIGIEASSDSQCREFAPELTKALSSSYPDIAFLGCTSRDFVTLAEFRLALPILPLSKGDKSDLPLVFASELVPTGAAFGLYLDSASVNRVIATLPASATTFFDGTFDLTLTVDVRNDTDAAQTVFTNMSFVDGKPTLYRQEFILAPGQSLRIQPSDVVRTNIGNGGDGFIFGIKLTE